MSIETMGSEQSGKKVTFKVMRFDPDKDQKPYFKEYNFMATRGMTILDGLMHIKEKLDSTLAYRKSCRMGICGSCAMLVSNKPLLACQTQISEILDEVIEIKPLSNFSIIRDVVPDLAPLFGNHQHIKPHIVRKDKEEQDNPTGEFIQSAEELEKYLQFSYCIKCGCCVSACPTSATDEKYLGPQALGQGYRYLVDSRDDGFEERAERLDSDHGPWRCHFAGECSVACPKGVDPAFAIQLLKRELVAFNAQQKRKAAPVGEKIEKAERKPDIPDAPAKTV